MFECDVNPSARSEVRYKCDECNRSYATAAKLDAHFNLEHSDGPSFKCDICGTLHLWRSSLTRCRKKCLIYGGRVNKSDFFFREACEKSLAIDGSLSHVSAELQELNKNLSRTKRIYLIALYNTSRESAKARSKKGREEAGVHDIDLSDFLQIYRSQAGLCFYTGMIMNLVPHSDWRASVERINPEKGYTRENTVLICAEFNSAVQWTLEKIEQFKFLLNKEHEKTIFEMQAHKDMKGIKHRRIIQNATHCICNDCGIEEPLQEFSIRLREGCKDCRVRKLQLRRSTPQGHFSKLLTTMRQASKVRGHAPPTLTQNNLIDILNGQGGLCAYTGLMMSFGSIREKSWVCSVDRKDVSKGYTAANISLVCYEFNTMDMSGMSGRTGDGSGSSGWNPEKVEKLKTFWNNQKPNDVATISGLQTSKSS